jgi:hypothetical protein
MKSQVNDIRRLVVDAVVFSYDSCKIMIAELCRRIRYLFSQLHEVAKSVSPEPVDETISSTTPTQTHHHRPISFWNLQSYKDPMFKSIFSKEIRSRLRQVILYSELYLRDGIRHHHPSPRILEKDDHPSTITTITTATTTRSLFPKMVREFLDRSRLLVDKGYKWLTWLDSKLSTEFDLPLKECFTCDRLQLPLTFPPTLFKMMNHDLQVAEICHMRSFSFLPFIAVFSEDTILPLTQQTTRVFNQATLTSETIPHDLAMKLSPSRRSKSPTILHECIRCGSVIDTVDDGARGSLCSCGGIYRSIWKKTVRSLWLTHFQLMNDLFCPL